MGGLALFLVLAASPRPGLAGDDLVPFDPGSRGAQGSKAAGGAAGGPLCLAAGTPVLTPDGPVPVESLAPGDRLISMDEAAGRPVEARVLALQPHGPARTVLLRAQGGAALAATPEHPLYDPGEGRYRPAGSFRPGERVLAYDGRGLRPVEVTGIEAWRELPVLDLSVSGEFRNFVAGGLLAHNKAAMMPPDPKAVAAFRAKAASAAAAVKREGRYRVVGHEELLARKERFLGKPVALLAVPQNIHITAEIPSCSLQTSTEGESLPATLEFLPRDKRRRLLQLAAESGWYVLLVQGFLRESLKAGYPGLPYLEARGFREVGPFPPGYRGPISETKRKRAPRP